MYPGRLPVVVNVVADSGVTRLRLARECCVDGAPGLLAELGRLLGPTAVRVTMEALPQPAPVRA